MPSDPFLNPHHLKDLMQIAGMMILHSFILWQKKSGGVRPIAVGFALGRFSCQDCWPDGSQRRG